MSPLDLLEEKAFALAGKLRDRRLKRDAYNIVEDLKRLNTAEKNRLMEKQMEEDKKRKEEKKKQQEEEKKKKEEEEKKKKEEERKKKLPTKAITDIPGYKVAPMFGLKRMEGLRDPFWVLSPHERKPIPEYLKQILSDYNLAVGRSFGNEALIRTRLDAIFLTTLAAKKRLEFNQPSHRSSTSSQGSYKSVHIQFEKTFKLEWVYDKAECLLQGRTDYSFWHKDANLAETNTIIVEAKAVGKMDWHQALAYMSMIHHARRRAGRPDVTVYGIATDSFDWTFIKIDQNSVFSSVKLDWAEGQHMECYSLLHKLIDRAAVLSPVSTLSDRLAGVCFTNPME
ncbi:hypothetical protein BO83DRAFT_437967 [Aspergillus eucalypticola CBS 122712]|uniref:Uncharacterized protein n=1 Tax=Aspergillus eucalypticola (strain CBS 122712 / IBT 29274) TaxID=1448314 RepID=A0A317VGD5_ASPEC|nr:uncharacterized protein BO83DRAFT_437967 [Aspergillus eucalypticola CBS 122712]PWY72058.1 hypothetical protein BO83DRAFT_437967 [Aspergillus eucalypticola CBS 122712]